MMRLTYPDEAKAFLILNAKLNNSGYKYNATPGVASNLVDVRIGSDGKSISGNAVASKFCACTWS